MKYPPRLKELYLLEALILPKRVEVNRIELKIIKAQNKYRIAVMFKDKKKMHYYDERVCTLVKQKIAKEKMVVPLEKKYNRIQAILQGKLT
ncbi:MAG: hypothetical protein COV01_02115 [Candidatus Taylorbacteria bacterium CG10_big_fil_rev_8_21_14_0_10_41_48]|uniref:Uncharacterized protein n=1 Tax=Candidatus Taylorbacteria bacterium CG10_big_fil_rev_8_21_14_0_10_41_48 TaxID=1975024 RepID=A0A2M8LCC8_9BACT|nr:MAG: hypothetical protein COV01_02115 [Candidatus Taylorbacteria bacterium CG10_big_fil_rev_8_21_14_0_10_41_48]